MAFGEELSWFGNLNTEKGRVKFKKYTIIFIEFSNRNKILKNERNMIEF